ncbi:complex I subunit 1 family protein [Micromonospora costi]|uniref:NADH-quinone oxidoreductase subunit H n=1 Tax=Micromonospora costi TaxID=1530042 RepID=A0A3A9ZXN0_9ACTN|nr:complex I subunit 1 family protein [Micromonospora costi]RKN53011.1 NADH-quinone oxidoreductase subunit H [Micromonospora costi]
MSDPSVTVVPAFWALGAAGLLGLLASVAAIVDGLLSARAAGAAAGTGWSRPAGEVARLMWQRRRATVAADTLLWRTGGAGLLVMALMIVTVVPLGAWTLFDLDVGVVWFNAMDVLAWAFVWLTGWGANSAHALVGGYRFLAYGLAYELPLMFALVAPAVAASSLNVGTIAAAQQGLWFVTWMPLAFLVFCMGVLAIAMWGPFSAAVAPDVAGGVSAELSGVDRLLFLGGRYALLAAGAAFAVPMFLGGGAGPLLPAWLWVLVKTLALLAALVWLRRRLPVVRPDLFMEIGWVVLLPAVLLQDLLVAGIALARS